VEPAVEAQGTSYELSFQRLQVNKDLAIPIAASVI
jgi:hypothetical protein